MPEGRHSAPRGRTSRPRVASNGTIANEDRLVALGAAVDRRTGVAKSPRSPKQKRRTRRTFAFISIGMVLLLVATVFGGYVYGYFKFGHIHRFVVKNEIPTISGQPFNVLEIGSDSRVGLSGAAAASTGAGSVSGQRSDVIKIMHVDPGAGTVSIVSIPRDTLVSLLANQSLYTNYNRINVNYGTGPDLLVRTIEANFGIPINHVIQVSFGGLINAANALGGVYLNFPYPARDAYSGLNIKTPGCQLMRDFRALAIVRSRHYQYFKNGGWYYDGTSDYGRIQRQDAFIRALINSAKGKWNPATINSFITSLPSGVSFDSGLGYNEVLGLAYRFHNFNPANLKTFMLPVVSAGSYAYSKYGSVLVVDQPAAQKMLVQIFGSALTRPTNPPPGSSLQPNPPPYIPVTTTTKPVTTTTIKHSTTTKVPVTPTTIEPPTYASFNPVPCVP